MDWLLKTAAYAAHAVGCPECSRGGESNCGGISSVDLATAAAVLTAAVDHLRAEAQREIYAACQRITDEKGGIQRERGR